LGDLPLHKGIFPTYFKEFKVVFDTNHQINPYDTATREAGTGINLTGSGMYYASLIVDTSTLPAGDAIHFDLYTVKKTGYYGDLDVYPNWFAPIDHDAQSLDPPAPVPEPSTIMLLGSGLWGWGFGEGGSSREETEKSACLK